MIHTDERFNQRVEEEVGRLEQRTDAEVVVVAAERSGTYADVAQRAASAVTLLVLIVLMALPHPIHPALVVVDLVAVWLLTAWLCNGHVVIRRLSSSARKREQTAELAAAEFHREAVHATPRRTGLLVYVSALEGRVELIPDVGLEARIPRALWAEAVEEFSHDDLEHFLAGLRRVGELLAEHVPNAEGKPVVDLPNAPRVRG